MMLHAAVSCQHAFAAKHAQTSIGHSHVRCSTSQHIGRPNDGMRLLTSSTLLIAQPSTAGDPRHSACNSCKAHGMAMHSPHTANTSRNRSTWQRCMSCAQHAQHANCSHGAWLARPQFRNPAPAPAPAASAASGMPGGSEGLVGIFSAYAAQLQQQQQQHAKQNIKQSAGADLDIKDLTFHPPGADQPLLQGVNLHLPANKLGLIIGRSGSGKTTLLQVIAGLCEQTGGQVHITRDPTANTVAANNTSSNSSSSSSTNRKPPRGAKFAARWEAQKSGSSTGTGNSRGSSSMPSAGSDASATPSSSARQPTVAVAITNATTSSTNGSNGSNNGTGSSSSSSGSSTAAAAAPGILQPVSSSGNSGSSSGSGSSSEERMRRVGLVFQFPERHFLGEDLFQELTFTWPRSPQHFGERQQLAFRVQQVMASVGLESLPLYMTPVALSGGQQRRLALAIQLIRQPLLLLLDEPLAGLDWQSRAEVVALLQELKQQCTLLVVSHDLKEVAPLVDCAWEMKLGGTMEPVKWPPKDLNTM